MGCVFFDRYSELCNSVGETPNSIAKIIGASSGSVTAWKNGAEPRHSTIVKIANYFGVSVGYLSGEEPPETKKDPEEPKLSEVDQELFEMLKQIPEDVKRAWLNMGYAFLNNQRKDP